MCIREYHESFDVFQYVVINIKTHRGPLICFYMCFMHVYVIWYWPGIYK